MCFLTDNIYDYYNVSQGKITIPSMDDGEEFSLTDVSLCFTCNVNVDFLVTLPPPCIVFNLYILRNPKKTNQQTKNQIRHRITTPPKWFNNRPNKSINHLVRECTNDLKPKNWSNERSLIEPSPFCSDINSIQVFHTHKKETPPHVWFISTGFYSNRISSI